MAAEGFGIEDASPAPVLAALACHGTNAAVFASEVRALAESKDPRITNLAFHALKKIEPASMK